MYLSKINIKNFKSFDDATVDLNKFNVIVGECASGKSNLIDTLKFLKNLCENMGGNYSIQNYKHKSEIPTSIKLEFKEDKASGIDYPMENNTAKVYFNSIEYELSVNWQGTELKIIDEAVKFDFEICDGESKLITSNSLILKNHSGEISSKFLKKDKFSNLEFFTPEALINIINNNFNLYPELLIKSALSYLPVDWGSYFKKIKFYDFDVKMCKMMCSGFDSNLNENGDNLALMLENILAGDDKRKFINLVSSMLPYVKSVGIDNTFGYKEFKVYETYDETPVISKFTSDGTVTVLALIAALYFSDASIIFIEEPERNIHPSLFIKLVNMVKEISNRDKQIIVTTHSPEFLDYCDLEDIRCVFRNQKGFSVISQPENSDDIVGFVE